MMRIDKQEKSTVQSPEIKQPRQQLPSSGERPKFNMFARLANKVNIQDQSRIIKNKYKRMHISTFEIMCDPFLDCIFWPCFAIYNCTTGNETGIQKRLKILGAAEDKLSSHLDIVDLIKKVNRSDAMLENIVRGEQAGYVKYHSNSVI